MFPKCQCQYILQFICEYVVCLTFLTFLHTNVSASTMRVSERLVSFMHLRTSENMKNKGKGRKRGKRRSLCAVNNPVSEIFDIT